MAHKNIIFVYYCNYWIYILPNMTETIFKHAFNAIEDIKPTNDYTRNQLTVQNFYSSDLKHMTDIYMTEK